MDSQLSPCFQFIIAHGISDSPSCRMHVRNFWSARFPKAKITEVPFLPQDVSWGERGFINTAEHFLETVERDRNINTDDESFIDVPRVILCHELGGCLVKQIFCGTPDFKDGHLKPENHVLQLLSGADFGTLSSADLTKELPPALERLSWQYPGISDHYKSEARCESGEMRWEFAPGDKLTEAISDTVKGVVDEKLSDISQKLQEFLQILRLVDTNNHQLQLQKPFMHSPWWNTEPSLYQEWESLNETAPNILHVHGIPESSGVVLASQLFFEMQKRFEKVIIITYSFRVQDLRTQHVEAFLTSLIRQILRSHPSLFRRVSFIAHQIVDEEIFSYEVLRSLLLALLRASVDRPLLLILNGAQDCKTSPVDILTGLVREHRKSATGGFKIIVLGESSRTQRLEFDRDICCNIDFSEGKRSKNFHSAFVQSTAEALVRSRPQWRHCLEATSQRLSVPQSYVQVGLLAKHLEISKTPSTMAAMTRSLESLPSTIDEAFMATLRRCEENSSLCIRSLIQWVLHTVRPLTVRELSIVAALSSVEKPSIDVLKLQLPTDLSQDLGHLPNTLLQYFGTYILPTYGTTGSHLLRRDGNNSHSIILSKCLAYLEAMFDDLELELLADEGEIRFRSAEGFETEFLEYAVKEWPQHYILAPTSSSMADHVLEFFSNEKHIKAWFELYCKYTDFSVETYVELDSALKVACWFGLSDVAEKAIEKTKGREDEDARLTEALDLAAANGQKSVVSLLLTAGTSYNFGLCWASEGGFDEITHTLLEVDKDAINNKDKSDMRTPFILAALGGNEKIAAYLLENGADPSHAAGNDLTALHLAAMTGQMAIVQPLIEAEVNVKAVTSEGNNALRLAAAGGFDDIVKLLLLHETDVDDTNDQGMTALHLAVENGHTSICKLLFKAEASLRRTTGRGFSPLHIAAEQGFVDIVRWLLANQTAPMKSEEPTSVEFNEDEEKSTNTDEDNLDEGSFDDTAEILSPLQLASRNGNTQVVYELLQHADYNTERERSTSLLIAADKGFMEVIEGILKFGTVTATRNLNGNTALHLAARQQHAVIVSHLSKLQSDKKAVFNVNEKNESGWTPLHFAALSGRYITLLTLLNHGAKMADTTASGQTVLHIAASSGHLFVLRDLIKRLDGKHDRKETDKEALLVAQDTNGDTPFTLAVHENRVEVMKVFLERMYLSPDRIPSLQGDERNALILAAEQGHLEATKLLIESAWDIHGKGKSGDEALHRASAQGHVPIIELLVEKGAEVNAPGNEDKRAIHYAILEGHLDAVEALLDNQLTDIDSVDQSGATPLWQAAYSGKAGCVKTLLQRSPKLNVKDKNKGWTALHAAYDSPDITKMLLDAGADPTILSDNGTHSLIFVSDEPNGAEAIRYYLDAGVDPNVRDPEGLAAIHLAAKSNKLDIIKLLKEFGADVHATGNKGETALHLAAYWGYQDVVEYLLECGLNANQHSKSWGTPLMAAAKGNEAEIAKVLLALGTKVNAISDDFAYHTALQAAAWAESLETVQALLNEEADVNLTGGEYGSPLCAAAYQGNREIALLLLDKGAELDYVEGPEGTALECALSQGYSEVAELFLERKAAVNLVSKGKRGTALLAAVHTENLEMVQDLLDRGADANLGPKSGEVPALVAIRKGRQEILEVIVNRGGKLSFKDKYGRGAVSNAILHFSPGLLPYMWGRDGIDVNETDAVKRTPLMLAVLQGVDVIKELHNNGADLDVQDQWGNTALMYAVIRDYPPLASELIECGASPLPTDIRRRDALYWACRNSSLDTFNEVHQRMVQLSAVHGRFQSAISAAVASGEVEMVKQILENIRYSQKQVDDDGWTDRHNALRYGKPEHEQLIKSAVLEAGQKLAGALPAVKLPTEWHESDLSAGLLRGLDTRTLTISKTFSPLKTDAPKGLVRADHPMWPQEHGVYYFEITISNDVENEMRRLGIGFCDETTSLGVQLGWTNGSWGYHGDDGNAFGEINTSRGSPYGPTFGHGDVIGCGVNFDKEIAFYTKNGEVIGRAFTDVRGKLYPAISVDLRMVNCVFSARFWQGGKHGNEEFIFKGPFDDQKIFQETERAITEAHSDKDSDSGSEDSWFSG
ncbi:hypothetical protein BFJ70_g8013 [Fusarium oxysporum]|nr:hypothetical protein BFJ70_g8013 [Fusarium oxysporum]